MKIIKAFSPKGCDVVIGFTEESKKIRIEFWPHCKCIDITTFGYGIKYFENNEDYEQITTQSFNRMLRVVKNIIDKQLT